jgi:hypothetical protein
LRAKQDEEAAAQAYTEFVEAFEGEGDENASAPAPKKHKGFVKAGGTAGLSQGLRMQCVSRFEQRTTHWVIARNLHFDLLPELRSLLSRRRSVHFLACQWHVRRGSRQDSPPLAASRKKRKMDSFLEEIKRYALPTLLYMSKFQAGTKPVESLD